MRGIYLESLFDDMVDSIKLGKMPIALIGRFPVGAIDLCAVQEIDVMPIVLKGSTGMKIWQ